MFLNDSNIFVNYVKQLINKSPVNKLFKSNTSYYDSLTHFYLGEYLRYLRDIKKLDLMSLYNVWGGNIISDIKLENNTTLDKLNNKLTNQIKITKLKKDNTLFDLMQVMIKPNTDYTIYIDSNMPVLMTSIAFDKNSILTSEQRNSLVKPNCKFNQPFIYRVDIDEKDSIGTTQVLKDYLSLMIYIPKQFKNRLILEGDYTDVSLKLPHKIGSEYQKLTIVPYIEEYLAISKYPKAFSDDLISYLLNYCITDKDEQVENIQRIQEYISSVKFLTVFKKWYNKPFIKGTYEEDMRRWLFDFKQQVNSRNNLGFIDRELEQLLIRGGSNA